MRIPVTEAKLRQTENKNLNSSPQVQRAGGGGKVNAVYSHVLSQVNMDKGVKLFFVVRANRESKQ